MNTRPKFYTLEDMTQEDLKKLALERNTFAKETERLNNIIEELEKDCIEKINKIDNDHEWYKWICPDIEIIVSTNHFATSGTMLEFSKSGAKNTYKNMLEKIRELKEGK